ncbi:MAG: hypothetical protein Q9167_001916 [Letrouitia subvulpina]
MISFMLRWDTDGLSQTVGDPNGPHITWQNPCEAWLFMGGLDPDRHSFNSPPALSPRFNRLQTVVDQRGLYYVSCRFERRPDQPFIPSCASEHSYPSNSHPANCAGTVAEGV